MTDSPIHQTPRDPITGDVNIPLPRHYTTPPSVNTDDYVTIRRYDYAQMYKAAYGSLMDRLKTQYPNGHPLFKELMLEAISLHDRKNKEYAKGGEPLGNFSRVAKIFELYPKIRGELFGGMVVAVDYLIKHFDAVLWALNNEELPNDENLADLVVYFAIMRCQLSDIHNQSKLTAQIDPHQRLGMAGEPPSS